MKPLAINFAPRRSLSWQASWLAGGVTVALAVVTSSAWLLTTPVEASHMAEVALPPMPSAQEIEAIDAAVGKLNTPWLAVLDALAVTCGLAKDAGLLSVEGDARQGQLRLVGEAANVGVAQALPARLREQPGVAGAVLVGQEMQENNPARPVRFVIELQIGEHG